MSCKKSYPDQFVFAGRVVNPVLVSSTVILRNQIVPLTPIRKARKGAAPVDAALLQTRCTRCGEVFPTVLRRMKPYGDVVRNVPQCDRCRHRYLSCGKDRQPVEAP